MKSYPQAPALTFDTTKSYTATIETTAGTMTADLFPSEVPATVNNFVFLAREFLRDPYIARSAAKALGYQLTPPAQYGRAW